MNRGGATNLSLLPQGSANEAADTVLSLYEYRRLTALHSYRVLHTAAEKDFDDLALLASTLCQTPMALIGFVSKDRLWVKSHIGIDATEIPFDLSFCAETIKTPANVMVVQDARLDSRWARNPFVTGASRIAFYAGAAIVNSEGYCLGTLCVMDYEKKDLSPAQRNALAILAGQVMEKLEMRKKERELNEAHRTIQEVRERLTLALDAAKLGSYDLDLQTGLMECSAQCKMNFGLAPDVPFNFPDLINSIVPEHRENVTQRVNTAITNREIYNAEYMTTWGDGSKHWINAFGKVKYDAKGAPLRILGVTLDITERKRLEQQKDDFLGIASHELKTPITTLKASLQLLNRLKEDEPDELVSQLITTSYKSMQRINALVDDLLNINQMNEGALTINRTHVNLAQLVEASCTHIRLNGQHELHIEGDLSLCVFADEHRIEQVVVNFVNNAVKYAPASKKIFLLIEQDNGNAKVSVKDTGSGIPPEQIDHLFERYWRADRTASKYSGLGMGLFICTQIIKKHNGKIGVHSVVGEGSTFWFTLPL